MRCPDGGRLSCSLACFIGCEAFESLAGGGLLGLAFAAAFAFADVMPIDQHGDTE